jgi:hypothetical protein
MPASFLIHSQPEAAVRFKPALAALHAKPLGDHFWEVPSFEGECSELIRALCPEKGDKLLVAEILDLAVTQ